MAAPAANILAWLRPEEIDVVFAEEVWRMQASTAADWLGAIAMDFDGLSGVFPGLIADDRLDEMAALLRDPAQFEQLQEVARKVVQAAGGRDWWWTVNLARRTVPQWIYINGFLVRQGIRASETSFPDWLDACYTWLWERGDENQRIALDMELSLPPKGVRTGRKQMVKMMEDFAAD